MNNCKSTGEYGVDKKMYNLSLCTNIIVVISRKQDQQAGAHDIDACLRRP
jgi:hypothetical protein